MAQKTHKKRPKEAPIGEHSQYHAHVLMEDDARFANVQTDPRFRLPGAKQSKVTLDRRFARLLDDNDRDFHGDARVDRYGRRLHKDKARQDLKKYYRVEEPVPAPEEDLSFASEDDFESSSDDASTTDTESEEEVFGALETNGEGQPVAGEISSRLAVVNLDWDNIKCTDLMAVFSSFLPAGGRISTVAVYPSEFGRERMQREELEGPPRELFEQKDEESAEEDDDAIEKKLVQEDMGIDFNSAKLRRYQLERLRYYYAVISCSSAATAQHIYDAVDGTEYLTSANFFDLRYIPDDMDFSEDTARDECSEIPDKYRPNDFVTDALQHSKVKLTWDMDDGDRKEAQKRAFSGSRQQIDENDLRAYLGSDSSESADESRVRSLLGLSAETAPKSVKEDRVVGDMQVTFRSGLTAEEKAANVFENTPQEANETTAERYVRKEKERKARRREKARAARDDKAVSEADVVDAGFDDPFFTHEEAPQPSTRERKLAKRTEREAIEAKNEAQRTALEPLMTEDNGQTMKHFDMNALARAEKKAGKGRKQRLSERDKDALRIKEADDFRLNVEDSRFTDVFNRAEYAIDPTHPRYLATSGMKEMLKRRRHTEVDNVASGRLGKKQRA